MGVVTAILFSIALIVIIGLLFHVIGFALGLILTIMLWLIPVILVILLIFLIFDLKVKIKGKKERISVKLAIGIINISLYDNEKNRVKIRDDGRIDYKAQKKLTLDDIGSKCRGIQDFYHNHSTEIAEILTNAAKCAKISKFDISILVGTEDAASTALVIPMISTAISFIVGILSNFFELPNDLRFDVIPNFAEQVFQFNGNIIINIKTFQFIKTGIMIYKFYKKNEKEISWLTK